MPWNWLDGWVEGWMGTWVHGWIDRWMPLVVSNLVQKVAGLSSLNLVVWCFGITSHSSLMHSCLTPSKWVFLGFKVIDLYICSPCSNNGETTRWPQSLKRCCTHCSGNRCESNFTDAVSWSFLTSCCSQNGKMSTTAHLYLDLYAFIVQCHQFHEQHQWSLPQSIFPVDRLG